MALWFTRHLRSACICHTVRSRNNTHSSLQPSTVMLHQAVLGSFQPVTPVLVTTGTPILHPSQCSPRSTSSASHHPALHECTYRRKNLLPSTAQHFHTECFPSPSTCMYTQCCPALSWFTCGSILWYWLGIKSLLNGSSCLWMRRITSGCLVLPLNASCGLELESCHLWMRHVTILHVLQRNLHLRIYRESTASLLYLYSHGRQLCSLQRVLPNPTLGVLSYLLTLMCRPQWVPTPYIWSSASTSCSPLLVNILEVSTFRRQLVLRYTWIEYTHSFARDTSNEHTFIL